MKYDEYYIPICLVIDKRLPDAAVRLWCFILANLEENGVCNKSQTELGRLLKVTDRHARRLLNSLENTGYITVTRVSGKHNSYFIPKEHLLRPDIEVTNE